MQGSLPSHHSTSTKFADNSSLPHYWLRGLLLSSSLSVFPILSITSLCATSESFYISCPHQRLTPTRLIFGGRITLEKWHPSMMTLEHASSNLPSISTLHRQVLGDQWLLERSLLHPCTTVLQVPRKRR